MAKAWAAMKAIFFLTSSNSPSGCSNCTRVLACVARGAHAELGRAGAAGAERGAAEVEHRQRDSQPLAELAQDVLGAARTCSRNASRPVAVPRMPHLGIRASTTLKPGMSGVTRKAVIFVSLLPGTGRAGHHGQHAGDAAVGDPALCAVEDVSLAVGRRRGGGLHVAASEPASGFGQGEGGELSRRSTSGGSQRALLLLGAEQQQGADADRVMGVDEDGRRGAVAADHFHDAAVGQSARSPARRILSARVMPSTPSWPRPSMTSCRDLGVAVDGGGVDVFVAETAHLGDRLVGAVPFLGTQSPDRGTSSAALKWPKNSPLAKPSVCGPENSNSSAACFCCSTCAAVKAMIDLPVKWENRSAARRGRTCDSLVILS